MLPILEREIVDKKKWATEEELSDYFAVAQCTPGIIAVNTATFIGEKQKGILGGILATLGVVFPSLVIITLLASVILVFSNNVIVQHAFGGIRVCVCVLILNSVLKLAKTSIKDAKALIIFIIVLILAVLTSLSPVYFVLIAGVAGVLIKELQSIKEKKK